MTNWARFLFFVTTIICFSACQKEVEAEDYMLHYETSYPLNDLTFDDNQCLAVGGNNFKNGYLISLDLENNLATIDTVQDRSLFSLTVNEDIICTGVYTLATNRGGEWKTTVVDDLYIMRSSVVYEDHIYAVGGAGLSSGVLYKYDLDLNLETSFTTEHDYYFIKEFDGMFYQGGYGSLRISEGPDNWQNYSEYEDHFIDAEYVDDLGTFILGASGRVLLYNIEGFFTEIRKPNTSGISDFNDLEISGDKMYISGYDRIIFTSVNDYEWEEITLADHEEINKMTAYDGRIYLVSENGKIASIAN